MFRVAGLQCLRCGTSFPAQTLFEGCPQCRTTGKLSNVTVVYERPRPITADAVLSKNDHNMWRYREFLGVPGGEITLGEGLTPLVRCERLGAKLAIDRLYLKNESQNPTGSYKDRLASASVTRALVEGARGVTISSTGNHGAATAAYAARAGLPCLIFTVAGTQETMKQQMQSFGPMMVATEDWRDRWPLVRYCVEELGWYSTGNYSNPPIGSSPYGIEGYKTIAYEVCESLGWSPPDAVVMPVAYGDGIRGIYKGFEDLVAVGWTERIPRMIAVETAGSLTMALKEQLDMVPEVDYEPSIALSIGTPVSTFQALRSIRDSGGTAVAVSDDEILEAQRLLGAREGIFAEPASAAVVAALPRLSERGDLAPEDVVVGILTSTGLKYPGVVGRSHGEVPVVGPDVSDMRSVLKKTFGYDLEG